jgi:hypothetical protein
MAFTLTTNHGTTIGSGGTAQNVGDLMIIGATNFNGSVTVSSIVDTFSTSYSNFRIAASGNTHIIAWGFLAGTGANTVTITWSAGTTSYTAYAEFTGASVSGSTQDGTGQSTTGSAATSTVLPNITTTGSDDLLINYVWANSGFTSFGGSWSTAVASGLTGLGYQADVAAGTYPASATFASSTFGSLSVAFKAASSGPSVVGYVPGRMPMGC